jgi:alpha-N-arabinofuranosidase
MQHYKTNGGTIVNPILPGFYPDPSLCRVGDDFYLVTSTFAWFPGIPVWHSRDLANWKQIGNAIDRPGQISLDGTGVSRGLFAPSIRWHAGTFYLLCTNVDNGGNFVITAKDPAGPWSDPVWLTTASGIDPSLFFDADGSAWYVGTRPAPSGEAYSGNWEVWVQAFDVDALARNENPLHGSTYGLWRGALRDCVWPEGPHLYRKDGWYYLLIAEGGTGPDHAVSVARSRNLTGPWVGKPSNPVITHRHLGHGAAVVNVGHADLFDDAAGNWWMVLLASRPYGGAFSNLGRETFLVPVIWEDDWPVASPGSGLVEPEYPAPALSAAAYDPFMRLPSPACEHFDSARLPYDWLTLRASGDGFMSLSERPGFLRLYARAATLREKNPVSFAGRRQRHQRWAVFASVEFEPSDAVACAGLALVQSEDFQYRLEIFADSGERTVRLVRAAGKADETLASRKACGKSYAGNRTVLAVLADGQTLSFFCGPSRESLSLIAGDIDGSILSTERAGGFVGTVVGVFASGNGTDSDDFADVDWFEYQGRE